MASRIWTVWLPNRSCHQKGFDVPVICGSRFHFSTYFCSSCSAFEGPWIVWWIALLHWVGFAASLGLLAFIVHSFPPCARPKLRGQQDELIICYAWLWRAPKFLNQRGQTLRVRVDEEHIEQQLWKRRQWRAIGRLGSRWISPRAARGRCNGRSTTSSTVARASTFSTSCARSRRRRPPTTPSTIPLRILVLPSVSHPLSSLLSICTVVLMIVVN